MPKGIDRFVSENRRVNRRIESTFIQVSGKSRINLDFGVSTFDVPTSIKVYSRPLNDSLISGHPTDKHGSGRGVSGDQRGSWTLETDAEASETFTRDGATVVADSLTGTATAAIAEIAVGDGSATASATDSALASETGRTVTWATQGSSADSTVAHGILRSTGHAGTASEFGVYSGTGNLYNRITTTAINPTTEQELKVEITFDVTGDGRGSSVITSDGEEAVAQTMRSTTETIGLDEFAFGTGTATPAKSDTTLANETFRKNVERIQNAETVTAHTVVFKNEPASQPVTLTEAGVFDNTGRLIWRTTFDGKEKNSDIELEAFAGSRAK